MVQFKKVVLFFILFFPILSFCKFDKIDKKNGILSRLWSKVNKAAGKLPIISKFKKPAGNSKDSVLKGIVSGNVQSYRPYDSDEEYDKLDRTNYTKLSKELFKAYFNRASSDDTDDIEDILSQCEKSKLYHLSRAFVYGARKLRKNLNAHKRTKVEHTIWSISQDFAHENVSPKLNAKMLKYGAVGVIFAAGCYFGEHYNTWGDITGLIRRIFRICW